MKNCNLTIILFGLVFIQTIFLFKPFFSETEVPEQIPAYYKLKEVDNERWPEKIVKDPTALFTALLTLFTGLLFWATKSLSSATDTLVQGAESTAKKQLRAYMFVEHVEFIDGNLGNLEICIKNFGQTPAYKCRVTAFIQMDFKITKVTKAERNGGTQITSHEMIAAPDACLKAHAAVEPGIDANILNQTERAIFVYGRLDYIDAFNAPHWVTFHRWNDLKRGNAFFQCERGNSADVDFPSERPLFYYHKEEKA